MRITLRQTGGWVPITKQCQLDSDVLPPDQAARLHRLLEESRIVEADGERSSKARDAQRYEISVEHDGTVRTVTFDDSTVPAEAWPLIEFLLELSELCPPDHRR